jgi:hypothetical protein
MTPRSLYPVSGVFGRGTCTSTDMKLVHRVSILRPPVREFILLRSRPPLSSGGMVSATGALEFPERLIEMF